MKWWILVFILVIVSISEAVMDVELSRGESYEFQGKNITILNLNEKDDKAIICVNNVKTIISDNKEKTINPIVIDLKYVKDGVARLRLDGNCRRCVCDESCSNDLCGIPPIQKAVETGKETKNEITVEEKEEKTQIVLTGGPIKESDYMILTTTLMLVVVVLGAIVLIRRSIF